MSNETSRGQAYTLEGVLAALVVVGSVLVGFQTITTAPWTSGTAGLEAENQQQQASDLLATTVEDGSLSRAIRCVDGNGNMSATTGLVTEFGETIKSSMEEEGYSYRLSLSYRNETIDERERIVIDGSETVPDANAVTASRTVTLTDNMTAYDVNSVPICQPRDRNISEMPGFYTTDTHDDSPVYNVVEVRLDLWR